MQAHSSILEDTAVSPIIPQQKPDACSQRPENLNWKSVSILSRWLMVAILVLAGFLRTQEISRVGVSFDESFCQRMVEFSWREMIDRIGDDTHPPLFYFVLKIWGSVLGNGIIAGRLLSAMLGTASVGGIYAFVSAAYTRRQDSSRQRLLEAEMPALLAALMMAMAPLQIFWTLQIRMYSLTLALTIWSAYFLIRALHNSLNQTTLWFLYGLLASGLIHSHPVGLFMVTAQFLYAIVYRWREQQGSKFEGLKPVIFCACGVWLSFQAWLPVFLEQRNRVNHNFYLPKLSAELAGKTVHELFVGMGTLYSTTGGIFIAQVCILVLLGLALGRRRADILILLSIVLPVSAAIVISAIATPIVTARYFMFSQVFFISAIALVACRLPPICRIVAIPSLLILAFVPCRAQYLWRAQIAELPGMQAAVAKLEAARGEQPVVVGNPMLYTSVLSYIHDRRQVYNYLPKNGFPFYQGTPVMRADEFVDLKWLEATDADQLWTLDADDSMGRVPLPESWQLLGQEQYQEWFAKLTVRLYVRDARRERF